MKLDNLTLYKFRNYNSLKLKLNPGLNIVVGKNGQGKTNLIESIHLLSNKGLFRTGQLNNVISKIDNPLNHMQISAEYSDLNKNHLLKFNIKQGKKSFLIDNKPYSLNKMNLGLQTVIFSPESLQAIKSGPEQRRILIDELVILESAENLRVLDEYKKTLKTKNKILRDFKQEKIQKSEFLNLIDSINELFLTQSLKVTFLRLKSLKNIVSKVEDVFSIINRKNVDISVEYSVSETNIFHWDESKVQQFLEKRQTELFQAEMHLGSSLNGPHRHDISILCNGEDSRYYCSQGQQRAIILSFKIAQVLQYIEEHGEAPVLLLDDVLSELDKEKRSYIVEFVNNINAQIFITSTELLIKEKLNFKKDFSIFKIENGNVQNNLESNLEGVVSV